MPGNTIHHVLVRFLILNLYWRGSPAVGEWCGTENVIQIEEMIVDLSNKCKEYYIAYGIILILIYWS